LRHARAITLVSGTMRDRCRIGLEFEDRAEYALNGVSDE